MIGSTIFIWLANIVMLEVAIMVGKVIYDDFLKKESEENTINE